MTEDRLASSGRSAGGRWDLARALVGGPLHPGGERATAALLDRADVGPGSKLLDLGCGDGTATAMARDRDAVPIGLDHAPTPPNAVRGDVTAVPLAENAVDVVLSECTLCLAESLAAPLGEARRVLASGGRLAVSDVVLAGEVPRLPDPIARLCCLNDRPNRDGLLDAIERQGFVVEDVRDHREDLLAMRDRIEARVDYETLLATLDGAGTEILEGVRTLETAVEDGRVGYVSVVAT